MRAFSILLIRVLGLYLFLSTLFSVSPLLIAPSAGELWSSELLPVLFATVAVPLLGGVLLWCFAGRLASRMHGAAADAVHTNDDDLVRAGTFLIGIYLLVRHLGALLGGYATAGVLFYQSLIVVVLSLGMLLGTRWLGTLYTRLKTWGWDK